MSLRFLLLYPLLITRATAVCSDFYSQLTGADMNPSLLQEGDLFKCFFNDTTPTDIALLQGACSLSCPAGAQLTASTGSKQMFLSTASFSVKSWHERCRTYVDGSGTSFPTRCNSVDAGAVCTEATGCTCSAGYTGTFCGVLISTYNTIEAWLGTGGIAKMLDVIGTAQSSPAALVNLLPSIYAFLPQSQQVAMSWTLDEMIDSVNFEMRELDIKTSFTQVFDQQLGNCYTFNYANKTNSFDGLHHSRFAGQNRDFSIILKLDASEQVAWIESAAISVFIHAPGTPPAQGVSYAVRGGASDLIALQKAITNLIHNCYSSIEEMNKNQHYYEAGAYTQDGCYAACYQDRVLAKCGCMDARIKKADTASQCLFKDTDCVNSVSTDASSWSDCKCLTECYREVYTLSATRANLPSRMTLCTNATSSCSSLSQSTAHVTIYMDSLESKVYLEVEKTSFWSFLSNVGGQLGFLLGMSVVGLLEIAILCGQLVKDACTKNE